MNALRRAFAWDERKTAIFRQVNEEKKWVHHDALEFPDGDGARRILLIGTVAGRRAPFCLRIRRDDRLTALAAPRSARLCD